jgi:hypothetical protein
VKNLFGLKGKREEGSPGRFPAAAGGGGGGSGGRAAAGQEEVIEFRKFELPNVNMVMDEVRA